MTASFLNHAEPSTTESMSKASGMDKYQKAMISLRYWLLGKEFYRAAEALEYAAEKHTGFRKCGVIPVISHPVTVTNYLRTLVHGLFYQEETLIVSLLHDTVEDTDATIEEIDQRFGTRVSHNVDLLSKQHNGKGPKKPNTEYYAGIASHPISSIVKAADRIHNYQTMVGVFTLNGQKHYIKEGKEYVLPMLKQARRAFPAQEAVYENAKLVLNSQIALIQKTWPEEV